MRLLLLAMVLVPLLHAVADVPLWRNHSYGDSVPVSDDEVRAIQLQLIEAYPFLASSEGIKAIFAQLLPSPKIDADGSREPAIMAYVFFYPYAESHGIRRAALATCWSPPADRKWDCESLESRNYVRFASQEFEVRVSDDISMEMVKTLYEVTQRELPVAAAEGDYPLEALVSVSHSYADKYLVTWGTNEGYGAILFKAELLDSAHPTLVESWRAVIVKPGDEI